ncbi:hypothetical protein JXA80_00055 [bacterium]|nr:hypothetical protein [candidate division CSSED10-310 bacterium]
MKAQMSLIIPVLTAVILLATPFAMAQDEPPKTEPVLTESTDTLITITGKISVQKDDGGQVISINMMVDEFYNEVEYRIVLDPKGLELAAHHDGMVRITGKLDDSNDQKWVKVTEFAPVEKTKTE